MSVNHDLQGVVDKSGTFTKGDFYLVSNYEYPILEDLSRKEREQYRVLHPRGISSISEYEDASFHTAELTNSKGSDRFRCLSGKHDRQSYREEVCGYVSFRRELADFVLGPWSDVFVVSGQLRQRLEKTNLRGHCLSPLKYKWNGEPPQPVEMPLFIFQFIGGNCERAPTVVGVPNLCPHCQKHPVICPECGFEFSPCPTTRQPTRQTPAGRRNSPVPGSLLFENYMPDEKILDGCRWDGCDFVQSHSWRYMSHRAFEWFTRIHSGPLLGLPIQFCIDRMTDDQRRWLADARNPETVVES